MTVCPEAESSRQSDSGAAESGVFLLPGVGGCAVVAALSFALDGRFGLLEQKQSFRTVVDTVQGGFLEGKATSVYCPHLTVTLLLL